jgi:quercetin dioxygenase-like cupin family protein
VKRLAILLAAIAWAANPVVLDNEYVRVVTAENSPGQKSRPHTHEVNRVMVHLDPGKLKLVHEDGTVREPSFTAGQIRWDPKVGLHTSENTSGTPIHIVEIELKNRSSLSIPKPEKDPILVAWKQFKLELDNEQVRILRLKLAPGEVVRTHTYIRPRVVVYLNGGRWEKLSGEVLERKPGEVAWATPGDERWKNVGKTPVEAVVVEIK